MLFGITSFKEMQDDNYIYVDKTNIIAKFVNSKGPHFLSRPRRFGKSTLVDTLDVLFSQGIEAFKGLKITQSDTCESLDEIKQRLKLNKTYAIEAVNSSLRKITKKACLKMKCLFLKCFI